VICLGVSADTKAEKGRRHEGRFSSTHSSRGRKRAHQGCRPSTGSPLTIREGKKTIEREKAARGSRHGIENGDVRKKKNRDTKGKLLPRSPARAKKKMHFEIDSSDAKETKRAEAWNNAGDLRIPTEENEKC